VRGVSYRDGEIEDIAPIEIESSRCGDGVCSSILVSLQVGEVYGIIEVAEGSVVGCGRYLAED